MSKRIGGAREVAVGITLENLVLYSTARRLYSTARRFMTFNGEVCEKTDKTTYNLGEYKVTLNKAVNF